jgi:hypothetical protein
MKIISSVEKIVRMINQILEDLILKMTRKFVDDLDVKESKTWYNHE